MLIKVKVHPDSSKQDLVRKDKDSFEIWVKEKPIKGQANRAVINLLSLYFKIPHSRIKLIKGWQMRNKVFEIYEADN